MNRTLIAMTAICLLATSGAHAGRPVKQRLFPAAESPQMTIAKRSQEHDQAITCKSYPKPGSRLEMERCMTRSEWAEMRLRTRYDLQMFLLR